MRQCHNDEIEKAVQR